MQFTGEILSCPDLPNSLRKESYDGEMHESQVQPFRFEHRVCSSSPSCMLSYTSI